MYLLGDILFDFGRNPKWNCPIPESDATIAASTDELNSEEVTLPHQEAAQGSLSVGNSFQQEVL